MHPQLETLLEIQDLKTQRSDLLHRDEGKNVEEDVFNISVDEAVKQLDSKIVEMEQSLEGSVRNRYKRLSGTRTRFIAPVINGTCFGCFVSIPTAIASPSAGNVGLHHCDNCGRFLYLIA